MRYRGQATEADRRQAVAILKTLISQPLETNRAAWEDFVGNVVELPLSRLESVRKVLAAGKWKAKLDPIAFIRKTAQTADCASPDQPLQQESITADRQLEICERVYTALESDQHDAGEILERFVIEQLHRPKTWAPYVLIAFNEKNKEGIPRWRAAKTTPFGLLNTITLASIKKWRPELVYHTEVDVKGKMLLADRGLPAPVSMCPSGKPA